MDQFLVALKRIIIQGIDWLFWFISIAWTWSFGQISRALAHSFQSLPDWKAILYIALVALLFYITYLVAPRIFGAIVAVFSAIWGLVETLMRIAIDMIWYIAIAYAVAFAINTFQIGAVISRMPWQ